MLIYLGRLPRSLTLCEWETLAVLVACLFVEESVLYIPGYFLSAGCCEVLTEGQKSAGLLALCHTVVVADLSSLYYSSIPLPSPHKHACENTLLLYFTQ